MDFHCGRLLGELSRRLGPIDMEAPTPEEKKLAARIVMFIHAWNDGDVEEDDKLSVADSDSSRGSSYMSDEDYEDDEGVKKPLSAPTSEEAEKLAQGFVRFSKRLVSPEEIDRALALHSSAKKSTKNPAGVLSRDSMKHNYAFLSTDNDWKKFLDIKKGRLKKQEARLGYQKLREQTASKLIDMIRKGKSLRHRDIITLAIRINTTEKLVESFKGSNSWIRSLTSRHKLRMKRVTKFVGRKKFTEEKDIEKKCEDFVAMVKQKMNSYSPSAIINMDQTGINRELTTSRYLALPDERQVVRMKLSSNGDRESVTAMPILLADGTLHDQLYLQFKEASGAFPKTKGCFKARNIVPIADKTSIMSYKTFKTCLETFVTPAIASLPSVLLILDSWKPFMNHSFIREHLPSSCQVEILNVPGGGTSKIQPADVGLYRQHKLILKTLHDHVRNYDVKINLHTRDSIIKVLSLVHRHLTHPQFKPFLQYAWYRAGYFDQHPPAWNSPTDVLFPRQVHQPCSSRSCREQVAFVVCVFCDKHFCAFHFFEKYHWC